jgi:hypothetical protein
MEKTRTCRRVAGGTAGTHTAIVLLSIPLCSRSDSTVVYVPEDPVLAQAAGAAAKFPYAIPLPSRGGWVHAGHHHDVRTALRFFAAIFTASTISG